MQWLEVDLGPGVRAGFTAADANLSLVVGSDVAGTPGRRAALDRLVGAPVRFARQVHGTAVLTCADEPAPDREPAADALVATGRGVAVGVLVADCVPVLLAEPAAGVVAAVHAGRRGLADGVLAAALATMTGLGALPSRVRAVLGPSVCGRCYEVPEQLQAEVAAAVPGTASTTSWGTPALDLAAGVRRSLADLGVVWVHDVGSCTLTEARWFSHRGSHADRSGARAQGRFAGVVRLLPEA